MTSCPVERNHDFQLDRLLVHVQQTRCTICAQHYMDIFEGIHNTFNELLTKIDLEKTELEVLRKTTQKDELSTASQKFRDGVAEGIRQRQRGI